MLSAKPWRLEMVLLFCAAQAVALCVGLTIIAALQQAGFAAFQRPADPGTVLVGTLAFQGVTWGLIPWFLRQHGVKFCDFFGLHRGELKRVWLPTIPVVIGFLPVAWLLQSVSSYALTKIGWLPQIEAAVAILTGAQAWWLRAYLFVFTVVIGPVAEEFIFRGVLYPFVKQRGYPRLAWFGVSFLFALIHGDAAAFVPLFVLALMLTWFYETTGRLLAPILAHAVFNAANLVLLCLFQYQLKPGHP